MERNSDRSNYSIGDRGSRSVSADRRTRSDFENFDPRSSYPYNANEVRFDCNMRRRLYECAD